MTRRNEHPAIDTDELSKSYGDHVALAPIDLVVTVGQRVSLIGHNGSGKTTLIKMLAGLLEPTGGRATISGSPAGSPDARSSLSYLSDQPVFYDDLTVRQHLEYIARLHRTDDWEDHANWLIDSVGLADRADDLPTTFSRGLKQKAAIAIAFVRPFDTMLIDEPFVGLDSAGRTALLDLIAWAHDDGASLVVATHELASVTSSDRLIALNDGEVIYDGDPAGADPQALSEGWFDRVEPEIGPNDD
ncbi:ABC transporter ATP-binding protein [Ilumatobacter nonamiensis]|uniref:ABC transporter ATP-binding protein n=1 Tax=Ilumatobacter nonamiensis TaxID=467093 RepID=UPI00034C8C93|nr:ABC transporter ATP-binding protein [Ilumatobacter nonamiensis]